MAIRYRFTSLTSTGGEQVTLPTIGVTCVVGGNNVGKSQFLKELLGFATEPLDSLAPVVIASAAVERPEGTVEETRAWLDERFIRLDVEPGQPEQYASQIGSHGITAAGIQQWFGQTIQGPAYLGNAASYFVRHAGAGSLSSAASGVLGAQYNPTNAPIGRLYRDGEIEASLDEATRATFGIGVVVDRVDVEIAIRAGSIDVPIPPINRPSAEYAQAMRDLPLLDSQGDGLRSFVGLAIQVVAEKPSVFLVDEPEAFLHPGQARAVGRWVAAQAQLSGIQLIVATHDRDFVLGLLGSTTAPVTLIRLTREGRVSHFTQLGADEVREVWDNPVLRYSNVLQGLFHNRAVICESDADCRFYGAAIDELAIARDRRADSDDVLFVPAGSKNRVGAMAQALVALGVPAEAILDFDILKFKADLKSTVVGVGADWTAEMDKAHRILTDAVNGGSVSWEVLKRSGLSGLPRGAVFEAGRKLLDLLRAAHVHVLPDGELEDFAKAINLHGAAWVSAALEAGVHLEERPRGIVERFLS